jgi:hypothetical protein
MFPKLTNINDKIASSIKSKDVIEASKLNCFVRIISGAANGLIMVSNPNWKLFSAAGIAEPTFYGDSFRSGTVGMDWLGKPVYASDKSTIGDISFKPSPIVTAINVKEGKDQISRHCDLKITAYTLAQVEVLQTYLMEPGYSLFIEYGWNTDLGVGGLIPTTYNTIVSDAGKFSLDQDSLHLKRIGAQGDYDSFFGFIVGGTVSSNGDFFDINIKLRGAPGLPTYLQSHNSIEVIENGKVSNKYSRPPFGVTDLNLTEVNQMAERRFKQMFNDLPKVRQTTFVTDLTKPEVAGGFSNLDFINFDPVIEVQISNYRDGRDATGTELPEDNIIVTKNTGATSTEVAAGTGGAQFKKLEEIAEKIFEYQTQIEKYAVPPHIPPGAIIDSLWEDYLEAKIKAGDPLTAEEINEAIKKYLTVGKIERNPWPQASYTATTYTKKPIQPAPAATAAVTASADKTGGGNTAAIANVAAGVNATEIELAGGLMLPKEKLFSKNKYVRFGKVVDILNANSSIQAYVVAGRQINTKLDIKDTPIGSFPGIYSCKPEALVIPGKIPDFSKFFMEQNLSNLNDGEPLVDLSIGDKSFTQTTELAKNGFSEKPNYWGYLENLYINFELLKKELDDTNKTIREVLQSLLNEMSSAVDGFWNFQIVEKSLAAKEKSGVDKKTVVYTVIDENWIGKNPNAPPVKFVHSGAESRFLDANLNIDIPGSTTSQIISKRLALSANPSQPNLELGGVFTSLADKFMRNYVSIPGSPDKGKAGTSGTSGVSGTSGTSGDATERKLTNTLDNISTDTLTDEQKKQKQALIDREIVNAKAIKDLDASKTTLIAKKNERASASYDRNLTEAQRTEKLNNIDVEIKALEASITTNDALVKKEETDIKTAVEEFDKAALDQIATNISTNLEKIDVVPNPQQNSITQDDLKDFMNTPALFKEKFRIYCCRDTKYLNILKVNAMSVSSGGGGRLSHPLPIKYSFTILGKSGIRRGDTFNIIGIPEKYANHGLFQVTQIEHTIQSMKWTTLVQGEYRQQQ